MNKSSKGYGENSSKKVAKGSKGSADCVDMKGSCTGLQMSNERRSDVTKAPTSKNPYPRGLA